MKQIAHAIAICMVAAVLGSCNRTATPAITDAASTAAAAPSMLSDISGVWRASDGTMVSIVYEDKRLRLLFGADAIPVQVGAIDEQNHTTNLKVTLPDGKPGIWTVSQIFDASNKDTFNLQLTLHDGTQDQLSFVRKISTDDLNVIAAAETRVHAGSISEALVQPQEQRNNTPAPNATASALPSATEPDGAQSAPETVGVSPSFDCTKAKSFSEMTICNDPELSRLDSELAVIYQQAKERAPDKAAFRRQTVGAWQWREANCHDRQCVADWYAQRKMVLESQ